MKNATVPFHFLHGMFTETCYEENLHAHCKMPAQSTAFYYFVISFFGVVVFASVVKCHTKQSMEMSTDCDVNADPCICAD